MEVKRIFGDWLEANAYVVSKGKNAIIIDCGANLEKVIYETRDLKILGILLTHGHFDHCSYALDYAKHFDCPIFASVYAKETLLDSTKNYSEGKFLIDDFTKFKFLDKDSAFKIGEFVIKHYSCPGHSPCCEGYLIDDLFFAGDVLFSSGIGRIDILGSDKQEMIDSLNKLQHIEFETLYSGHGEESTYQRQQRNISAYLKFLNR